MTQELRELQNKVFGAARSIKGIQNDLETRHKRRAFNKAQKLRFKFDELWVDAYHIEISLKEVN